MNNKNTNLRKELINKKDGKKMRKSSASSDQDGPHTA